MAERYDEQYRGDRDRGGRGNRRGFMERAGDEVKSWFGDDEAERRRHMEIRNATGIATTSASASSGRTPNTAAGRTTVATTTAARAIRAGSSRTGIPGTALRP